MYIQSQNQNIFCRYIARGCVPKPLLEVTGEVPVGKHGRYIYKKYFDSGIGWTQFLKSQTFISPIVDTTQADIYPTLTNSTSKPLPRDTVVGTFKVVVSPTTALVIRGDGAGSGRTYTQLDGNETIAEKQRLLARIPYVIRASHSQLPIQTFAPALTTTAQRTVR